MSMRLWKLMLCLLVGFTLWAGSSMLAPEWGAVNVAYADDDSDGDGNRNGKGRGRTITVSGNSTFSSCGDFALELTGDLEGCLTIFPKRFDCDELNGFDRYRERGKEHFAGTLNGEWGEFKTTYTLEAVYAMGFCAELDRVLSDDDPSNDFDPFAMQLAGGCDHRVKGKSGAFKHVAGLLTFLDVIPGIPADGLGVPGDMGASNFFYSGKLRKYR